jgi:predicted ATPase/DNA-binding winged helix-turn-helix (wHTH) protein
MQPSASHSPPSSAAAADKDGTEPCWRFGVFVVWEAQRRIERDGKPVRLGSRAFDLLLQLLHHAGELLDKQALLAAVWSGVVVEEASVRVHMSLLRKALGRPGPDDGCREWISSVPLRGYRFNGKVTAAQDSTAARATPAPSPWARLPARLTPLVGRKDELAQLSNALQTHRLVTLVGPGGIGKTAMALDHAQRQQASMATTFVDLAPLTSPDHVLGTLARALGMAADATDPLDALVRGLAERELLVLVDNCEHVIETLAPVLARLLAALPGLHVLATSREALAVPGECLLRLFSLDLPDVRLATLARAMDSPAMQLLLARASAAGAGSYDDGDVPALVQLSHRLDGIPLAIELAAARLGVQSPGDLLRRLDDHMRLLSIDNRAATARHRTLAAALDWSVQMLDECELRALRRLSLFRGRFDVDAALALIGPDIGTERAFDAVISLANKSLLVFDGADTVAPYRLLDTTRSYAGQLLDTCGERPACLRRHAALMVRRMQSASADLPRISAQAWGDRHAYLLDDVRFALDACTGDAADAATAAALIAASAPLWLHVSQMVEYRDRAAAILARLDHDDEADAETVGWLALAQVVAMLHTDVSHHSLANACERALAGARASGSHVLELQARWGQCVHAIFRGSYVAAGAHAANLLQVVQSWNDPAALNLAHRVMAMLAHFHGDFDASNRHCVAALQLLRKHGQVRTNMVGVGPEVAAKAMLSRTLWIQGDTAGALQLAQDNVELAESSAHATTLCAAFYGACPVALWSGELALAEAWIGRMMERARSYGLLGWLRYAEWFEQGLQLLQSRAPEQYVQQVAVQLASYDAPRREMLASFCIDWVDAQTHVRLDAGEGLWIAAEARRAIGRQHERMGDDAQARCHYLQARDIARRQGARAWEQRAAMDLARSWLAQGEPARALQSLDESFGDAAAARGNPLLMHVHALRQDIAAAARHPTRGSRPHRRGRAAGT